MEYSRSGSEYGTNVNYFIEFSKPPESPRIIEATIETNPIDSDRPYEFEVSLPPGGTSEQSPGGYEIRLDFNQSEEGWIEIKNTAGDNPRASKKLEVPHPMVFEISRTIVGGRGFYGQETWLKDQYSTEREGYHLIEFAAQSEKILKFRDHIRVLSFLANQNQRVANVFAENSLGYFSNRVLNASEPQSITSFSDLTFKLDIYNSQDFLSNVDINDILRESLDHIYITQRESGFHHAGHLLFRILPDTERDASYLSRKICSMYLSCLLTASKKSEAWELLQNWLVETPDIQGKYAAKIDRFETKFSNSDSMSESEMGNYLYLVGFNRVQSGARDGTLPLFQTSYQLIDEDDNLSQLAEFWTRMREGSRNMGSDDDKAKNAFSEALSVIDNFDDYEEANIEQWRRDALSGKYRAIVNSYEAASDSEGAIEYLNHFVKDDLNDLDSDSDLLTNAEGLRFELISKENIRNSAIDLARENIDSALENYSKSGLESARHRVYARKELLEAYIDEVGGNFESAAKRYKVAAEIHSNSLDDQDIANKYNDVSKICKAKSYLLDRNIKLARQHTEEISGHIKETTEHRESLNKVINVLEDYLNESVSETKNPGPSINDTRIHGLRSVEYNLSIAQFVIQSAQYLLQYGLSNDLLDTIINMTIYDALTPNTAHHEFDLEKDSTPEGGELLLGLSMDEVWQSKLPTHVHYQIEKLKITEVTTASDYSGLTNELTKTLEVLLVVISEYYSKEAYGEITDQIAPLDKTALGDLIGFVRQLPSDVFPIVNEIDEAFTENILPNREISAIRNAGHHGGDIRHSQEEYEMVRDRIIRLFRKLSPHCPIIVEVEDRNSFGMYLCVVHWGGIKTRIWLNTDAELQDEELYYIAPGLVGDKHLINVEEDSIHSCEASRARKAKEMNPVSMGKTGGQ